VTAILNDRLEHVSVDVEFQLGVLENACRTRLIEFHQHVDAASFLRLDQEKK
jgi:hypothetical protein